MDTILFTVLGLAILAGLVLFFSGRLRERYGALRASKNVTRAYEQYELNPDSTYYSSGPSDCPNALIGIDKRFRLDSDLWKQRDFDTVTFRETIQNMQSKSLSTMQMLHGFEIVDQQGRRVGTWFSDLNVRTTIKMLKDNRVRIDTPTLPDASEKP